MGTLPMGGKKRTFNRSCKRDPNEDAPLEEQYSKAKTDEERKAIFMKYAAQVEHEKMLDRRLIC